MKSPQQVWDEAYPDRRKWEALEPETRAEWERVVRVAQENTWDDPILVVCAAMLMDDGHVITGVRHYSPEMRETLKRAYGEGYHKRVKVQGFVDQMGNFLNREHAWGVAEEEGQIRREVSSPGTLYSENLY